MEQDFNTSLCKLHKQKGTTQESLADAGKIGADRAFAGFNRQLIFDFL